MYSYLYCMREYDNRFPFISYLLEKKGPVYQPTNGDLESGIKDSINEKGIPLVDSGEWRLVGVEAHGPHHPDGHTVGWMCRYDTTGKLLDWHIQDWEHIPFPFLTQIEDHIIKEQQRNSRLRVYFYIGFADHTVQEQIPNKLVVYKRGLQTQIRIHFHFVEAIPYETEYRELQVGCVQDNTLIETIYNTSGELALQDFHGQLDCYGNRVSTEISPRNVPEITLPRTLFGFASLVDAYTYTRSLLTELRPSWLDYANTFGAKNLPLPVSSLTAKQCPIPCSGIVFPSQEDRTQLGLTYHPVYTTPLTISGVIQTFDGAAFEHK